MSEIVLKNVSKKYDNDQYAVKNFNLDINEKEFVIFVGPSGCGKSTTLRMIAGLEDVSDGEIWIDGNLSNYTEPGDRGMSMVFQNYALYPNMTVYDNMAFSLKVRKMPKDEIDRIVRKTADMLEIGHLLTRKPAALSGGQKQRVAIGSAIVRKPKAFLMDEPLSNLDAKLRMQMRIELAKLYRKLDSTIIYVTHDQTEAMTLGTKIVVMKDGVIQQADTPERVYNNPINRFVAGFIGSPAMNFIDAEVGEERGKTVLYLGGIYSGQKFYPGDEKADLIAEKMMGRRVTVGVRPEDVWDRTEAEKQGFGKNSSGIKVKVENREMLGAEVFLYYKMDGKMCTVRLEPDNNTRPGEYLELFFDPKKVYIFDTETGANLFYMEG